MVILPKRGVSHINRPGFMYGHEIKNYIFYKEETTT